MEKYHGTTILGVKKDGRTVIAGDGQVSLGNTVIKPNAKKVRRIGEGGKVIGGFAGATADAFTLFERLEKKLEQYNGQLMRSAVEVAGNILTAHETRLSLMWPFQLALGAIVASYANTNRKQQSFMAPDPVLTR